MRIGISKAINIHKLITIVSTILFLSSTVILPRIIDMTGSYAEYVNATKVITLMFNLVAFIFLFKAKISNLLVMMLFIGVALASRDASFINYVLYVLLLFGCGDVERNISTYAKIKLLFIAAVVTLYILFGLNSLHDINDSLRGNRYTLGFTNPNTASMMLFDAMLGVIYLSKSKKKALILMGGVLFVFHLYTDSRTSILMYFILMILLTRRSSFYVFFKQLFVNFYFVMFIFTLGVSRLYDTNVNLWLNRRPMMMDQFLSYYPVNIFGHSYQDLIISVDNSYLRILIGLGIIAFILYGLLIREVYKDLYKNKDYIGISIVSSILIYDVFEQLTIAHGTIILVFIANFLIRRNGINKVNHSDLIKMEMK